jgi:hypothetical protein
VKALTEPFDAREFCRRVNRADPKTKTALLDMLMGFCGSALAVGRTTSETFELAAGVTELLAEMADEWNVALPDPPAES